MREKGNEIGKVIKVTRRHYWVDIDGSIVICTIRGKLAGAPNQEMMSVKVGDDVQIRRTSSTDGVIEKILERRSKLSRAVEGKAYREHIIATNIDQILIIMSAKEPPFKSGLLDRYLVIAEHNHLKAVICINKIDLSSPEEFESYRQWYMKLGYPLFFTSAITGFGANKLISVLKNKVSALVGHSGVGKSSLIKSIEPGLDLKISPISEHTKKGIHTTTFVQLYPLSFGGYVIDTPGIRELGLWNIFQNDLKKYFVEFAAYEKNCQFNNCLHLKEPGCAVKKAVEKEEIFKERYQNYVNIYLSLRAAPYELIKTR